MGKPRPLAYWQERGSKPCSRCKEDLPLDSFHESQGGLYAYCKECRKQYYYANRQRCLEQARSSRARRKERDWAHYSYLHIKYRAESKGIPIPMSRDDFSEWYAAQNKRCSYCKLEQGQLRSLGIPMSLDRLNSTKGYETSNIGLACLICNKVKLDFFSPEEMGKIGKTIRRKLLAKAQESGWTPIYEGRGFILRST